MKYLKAVIRYAALGYVASYVLYGISHGITVGSLGFLAADILLVVYLIVVAVKGIK